jgi:hypothetical protein
MISAVIFSQLERQIARPYLKQVHRQQPEVGMLHRNSTIFNFGNLYVGFVKKF